MSDPTMLTVSSVGDHKAMGDGQWFSYLSSAEKSCLVENGLRKVHYNLPDKKEMVEEYSTETNVLQRRMWKVSDSIGKEKWVVEVGDPVAQLENMDSVGIKETDTAPVLTKRLTRKSIEWRIRNLPYPRNVYSVTTDDDGITVRTTNKKYFKKIPVPELSRAGLKADDSLLSFNHQFNTLIITYKKPPKVQEMEDKILQMVKSVPPTKLPDLRDAPEQCRPS